MSEHVAVGIERTCLTQVVVALTAAIDVAHHVTMIDLDVRLTIFIDAVQRTFAVLVARGCHRTSSDGCNLTATKDTVTNEAAIHLDVRIVHTTVVDIAATKGVSATHQTVMTHVVGPGLVVQLLFVVLVPLGGRIVLPSRVIDVADIAVVDGEVGCSEDSTALATTIDVTLDGGHAAIETEVGKVASLLLTDAYHHIGLAIDICTGVGRDGTYVFTHAAFPSAAIDIAHAATKNIGIGLGRKGGGVLGLIGVHHSTAGTTGIQVLDNLAAQ